jgi:enoyl-CoA hydratase/carnithine racemase
MQAAESVLVDLLPLGEELGDARLGLIILNRPEQLNPIDAEVVASLLEAFDRCADDQRVRVIAVTGSGRAFSAGGDMKRYLELQRDAARFGDFLDELHELFSRLPSYPQPVLALVNGIAVAGGLELILFCDLAFASTGARIGDGHLRYGQMGGGGVLTMLPRAVGPARARELILSGRMLSAEEALEWGLVARVVEDGELLAAARSFAAGIAKRSSLAVANAKQVANTVLWEGTGVRGGLRLEREADLLYCTTSTDAQEGLRAFAEQREPRFKGR